MKAKEHKMVIRRMGIKKKNNEHLCLVANSWGEMERQLAAQETTLAIHTKIHNLGF
jgi:hypothetical protein